MAVGQAAHAGESALPQFFLKLTDLLRGHPRGAGTHRKQRYAVAQASDGGRMHRLRDGLVLRQRGLLIDFFHFTLTFGSTESPGRS